ncbi:cytochrome c3 family protein [Thiocapsa rosea]|uniref:Cytochrome c-type protein n=1 Tax=Thiocapsa rosea TaxID=69360 RepID=A0A495V348_9GAMM|nr:NapC/NirT family cytochrome c [Thiocapsa rosea]RKT43729.1 cytochrome c-type protein NapC [Thiocapsa rosea]
MTTKRKWLLTTLGVLGLLSVGILMTGGWILVEGAVQATSGRDFCTTCHSMEPFALAYDQDVHGGRNPRGLKAACVDCHLPHESPGQYLAAKVTTGIRDGWAELRSVFREPDWIGLLERRAEYVYDSGCIMCHAALEDAPAEDPTTALAHAAYFQAGSNFRCVTCHAHVGHKDLMTYLNRVQSDMLTSD